MTLARVVAAFDEIKDLPIEIPEVRAVVTSFGIQDHIVCIPEDSDPGKCRGASQTA